MQTILICDDNKAVHEGLSGYLKALHYHIYSTYDGESAITVLEREKIDLVILDVMLPGIFGTEVCRQIRKKSDIPVLMLSAKGDEIDRIIGLEIGADDYITKPFIVDELVARVKAHLRREKRRNSIGHNILKIGEIEIHKDSYEVYLNKELIDLSTREFQLFLYLCENAGQVLSREQIFNSVWGSDFGDIGTVAVNIKSLRDKIDKENKYIKTIWGVGYKLIKPIGEVI